MQASGWSPVSTWQPSRTVHSLRSFRPMLRSEAAEDSSCSGLAYVEAQDGVLAARRIGVGSAVFIVRWNMTVSRPPATAGIPVDDVRILEVGRLRSAPTVLRRDGMADLMQSGDEATFLFVEDPAAAHAFWRFVVELATRAAADGAARLVDPDGRAGMEVPPQIRDALVKTSYSLAQGDAVVVEAVDGEAGLDDVASMAMQPIGSIEAAIRSGELRTTDGDDRSVHLRDAVAYRNNVRVIRRSHLAEMCAEE